MLISRFHHVPMSESTLGSVYPVVLPFQPLDIVDSDAKTDRKGFLREWNVELNRIRICQSTIETEYYTNRLNSSKYLRCFDVQPVSKLRLKLIGRLPTLLVLKRKMDPRAESYQSVLPPNKSRKEYIRNAPVNRNRELCAGSGTISRHQRCAETLVDRCCYPKWS